jgi:L-ascorbate metabolism protein UlaG (beta-lactamase superfamily)
VYFAGDTAYHRCVFKRIREDFGRVDVALVPIGAYEPRNLMGDVHVDPEEAISIGRDVGAKTLVAMHWGTVRMTTEPPCEPPLRFRAAGKAAGYGDDALWVMHIGETRPISPW